MKIEKKLLLIFCAVFLFACSKEKDAENRDSDCIEDFYKHDRSILLNDSFDEKNGWEFYTSGLLNSCSDTAYVEKSQLHLYSSCYDGFAYAIKSLSASNVRYIAVEIKFREFRIRNEEFNSYALFFHLTYGNDRVIFGVSPPLFSMDFDNQIVHILFDSEKRNSLAFSQDKIPYSTDAAISASLDSTLKEELKGNRLTYLLTHEKLENTQPGALEFYCRPGQQFSFADPIPDSMKVEYVQVYEPIFPCR